MKHKEPVMNDPANPLVSILIYNYSGQYLQRCLDSIIDQDILTNFEIVMIDDATTDGSWDNAQAFLQKYSYLITIHRNRVVLGPKYNKHNATLIARGRYCATLTETHAFQPDYVNQCVQQLMSDPYVNFRHVFPAPDIRHEIPRIVPLPSLVSGPLVTVLCYNYNYGRYLRSCLESIFAQSYKNIELCFSDNASTDDSWQIALEFARRYPSKMNLTRNRKNFGVDANFGNCRRVMTGKYYINFCSDDMLEPDYVEKCVNVLEKNPNTGMAIVNRSTIDDEGKRNDEPPFYNQSCIIPGEEQAAVYMMAGVNPSVSQVMYRQSTVDTRSATGGLVARYYGTRILDFNISLDFDIAYIKDPLLLHRVHSKSDTNRSDSSLLPVIGMFVLTHQLNDLASVQNLSKVTERLPMAIEKLGRLAIRYSVRFLLSNDESTALRYFHLALAMSPQLVDDPTWQQLKEYWNANEGRKRQISDQLAAADNLATRTISYDPPAGSVPL